MGHVAAVKKACLSAVSDLFNQDFFETGHSTELADFDAVRKLIFETLCL